MEEKQEEVLNEEVNNTTKEEKPKKKKRSLFRILTNIILTIIVLIVILEAIVGIVNMQKIGAGEEPVWYLNKEVKEETNKVVTSYNLGLYRIVKTDTPKDTRTVLKLFFINE